MNIDTIVDAEISIEGETLPTLHSILEKHFTESTGSPAFGKIMTAQYISRLREIAGDAPSGAAKPETAGTRPEQPSASAGQKARETDRTSPGIDGEALLNSFGVQLTPDGKVDLFGAFTKALTPEGAKTPLGTLLGGIVRSASEAAKPRT